MLSTNKEGKSPAPEVIENGADLEALYEPSPFREWESRLARAVPLSLSAIAALKLLVVTPLLWWGLGNQASLMHFRRGLVLLLFLAFFLLDYLDTIIAREQGALATFGRVFPRLADYPLLIVLAYSCLGLLPSPLLGLKVLLDLLLLVLYLIGRGSPKNRLRSGINYATLLAMLFTGQGWGERWITPELSSSLLIANIVFHSVTALYNLKVLQLRFIGDTLSGANLLCGVISMFFAARGRLEFSLLFLMLGAAFDGFDGAAARKFGGTRWGVYSDDAADAVNYGIAPGVALALTLHGLQGLVLGLFYTTFTLSRLVFFTLNQTESDPNFFSGVPSTMGGLITICSLILFPGYPALVGLMVGVACVLMVSFDTHYRHLGRAMAAHRRAFFGMPFLLVLLLAGGRLFGVNAPVALILIACIAYGFQPTVRHLARLIGK